MASNINFAALLDKKYPSYTVEVNAFLESCDVSNSIEIATQVIYEKIKDDSKVDENLKLIYREALYGSDKGAKLRIKNRVTHFRRTLRPHPKIKQLDMLHAADYANMGLDQINRKLQESKKNDESFVHAMQEQQDCKRKIPKDTLIEQPEGAAEDVYWSDEDDCWKFKKSRFAEKEEGSKLEDVDKFSGSSTSSEKHKGKKFPFGLTGFSKASCISMVPQPEKSDEEASAGPCSKEFKEMQKNRKDFKSLDMDRSASESDGDDLKEQSLKTYAKKIIFGKKKLIPKKAPAKKLPSKVMSKAEKQFDSIINKDKKISDKDLALTSEEEPEKVSEDLKTAFNAKATKSEAEIDKKETLSKIRDCTSKVGKASVESTAFLRALGVDKGLDVGKYRDEVENELKADAKKDVEDDPMADQSEYVPLPDMNDDESPIFGADPTLWADSPDDDDEDTEMLQNQPLYQNQMEDPEVNAAYNLWFNELE